MGPSQQQDRSIVKLREPRSEEPAASKIPKPSELQGRWTVTHSTLPMWRDKRNVAISYSLVDQPSDSGPVRLEDTVTYQGMSDGKTQTIRGIDTAQEGAGRWKWRGKGMLTLITGYWEILGWGVVDAGGGGGGGDTGGDDAGRENVWVVTYFDKTLFTPAGIDIYSKSPDGHTRETVEKIRQALSALEDATVHSLCQELFSVQLGSGS